MKPEFFKKSWGWELWFANVHETNFSIEDKLPEDEKVSTKVTNYCGKMLFVEYDKWSSKGKFHYHKIKDETFFVLDGILQLDIVRGDNRFDTVAITQNRTFRVPPGMKHRFTSLSQTGCKFIEVSTFHSDDDSYRCNYDMESGDWVE